jgi:hypothetical protein
VVFLTRTKVWDIETPQQQQTVLDTFYKFLEASAKSMSDPDIDDHTPMLDCARQIGRALETIAIIKSSTELKTAAEQILGITPESKPDDIDARLKAVRDVIDTMYPAH